MKSSDDRELVQPDSNHSAYSRPDVVQHYAKQYALQPGEAHLFEKYIPKNADILDIGVGGGRTTPFLSSTARRYVGIDYSEAMVAACRERFPLREFVVVDALDMSAFAAESFDVAIFSFNGIDALRTDASRLKCFAEICRVMRPGAVFIFSSHNARMLAVLPDLRGADLARRVWRCVRAIFRGSVFAIKALCSTRFYRGEGYIKDPVDGGLRLHGSTPRLLITEVEAQGFSYLEHVAADRPESDNVFLAPWFYYAFRKPVTPSARNA